MQDLRRPHKPATWITRALAFALPMGILALLYVGLRVYPAGFRTILTNDLRQQYTSFFAWWRDALQAGEGLTFSLNKGMGGETVGFIAYYLLSPFLLLFHLVPQSWIPQTVAAVTLLKIGCAGLTMHVLLTDTSRYEDAPRWQALLFSTAYGLMAYNIVYQQNLMWMDGVIMLPLVVLGLHRLAEGRGLLCYTVSLWAAIVLNYYIGAMICLFSVLYFSYLLLRAPWPGKGRAVLAFVSGSAVAGMMAACILVPLVYSLTGGKNPLGGTGMAWRAYFSLPRLSAQLFSGTFVREDYISGMPNLYASLLALSCALGGLLSAGKRGVRGAVATLALLAALVLGMQWMPLNLLFHGLNEPVWFPYRQSFLFSFVMLLLAYQGLRGMQRGGRKLWPLLGGGATLCLLALGAWAARGALPLTRVAVNAVLIMAGSGLTALWCKRSARWVAVLLILLQCADLGLQAWWSLRIMALEPHGVFGQSNTKMEAAADIIDRRQVQTGAGAYYRREATFSYGPNDAMLYGYWGLTHFSSSEKSFVRKFLLQMGLVDSGVWAAYDIGSSMAVDSLLGVRYMLARDPYPNGAGYERIGTVEDVGVYENPYALPLGFGVREETLRTELDQADLFVAQNALWRDMTGGGADLFTPVQLSDPMLKNLEVPTSVSAWRNAGLLSAPDYLRTAPEEAASVSYTLTAPSADPLYLYFLDVGSGYYEVKVLVNDVPLGNYFKWGGFGVLPIGTFGAGQTVTVTLQLTLPGVVLGQPVCYAQSMATLAQYTEQLKGQSLTLTRAGGSTMTGQITVQDEDTWLLLTVPGVEGWQAQVDGRPVAISRALDALLVLPVSPGAHEVRLTFTPPGLWMGIAVSGAGLLLFLALLRREKCKPACGKKRETA